MSPDFPQSRLETCMKLQKAVEDHVELIVSLGSQVPCKPGFFEAPTSGSVLPLHPICRPSR